MGPTLLRGLRFGYTVGAEGGPEYKKKKYLSYIQNELQLSLSLTNIFFFADSKVLMYQASRYQLFIARNFPHPVH